MMLTGIVRRVDDLGRVVIPREVRRKLNISEGDPLEIFVKDEMVCFQKYYTDYADQLDRIANTIKQNIMDYDLAKRFTDSEVNEIFEKLNVLRDISKSFKEKSI